MSRFNHATQPVVGVSWYEANAYCAWLTAELRATAPSTTARKCACPPRRSGAEADGSSTTYPWGDDFDPALANTKESDLEQTTPVHMYPRRQDAGRRVGHGRQCVGVDGDVDTDGYPWLKGGAY